MVAMVTDASLGGGKLGKSKRGWGNLPPNIVHRIMDYCIPMVEPPAIIKYCWKGRADSMMMVSMINQRVWLSRLRTLSVGWHNAVNSLPFWSMYTRHFNPTLSFIPLDLHASRTTSSIPERSTEFHQALRNNRKVCHVCRINQPTFRPLEVQSRSREMSEKFGYFAACEQHARRPYCNNCLRDDSPYHRSSDKTLVHSSAMIAACPQDTDEDGLRYYRPYNCQRCRERAFEYQLNSLMIACARGSEVLDVSDAINAMPAAQDYKRNGMSTAHAAAKACLSDLWMKGHADMYRYIAVADQMQKIEDTAKAQYLRSFKRDPAPIVGSWAVILSSSMWGIPAEDFAHRVDFFRQHLMSLYDEWRDEVQDDDIQPITGELNEFWAREAFDVALFRFIRLRIRYGVWVSPADEVADLVGHLDITPVDEIFDGSRLPTGVTHRVDREYDKDNDDVTSLRLVNVDDTASCLPPEELLVLLSRQYKSMLIRYLRRPIEKFVAAQVQAGRSFEHTSPEPAEVLEYIAKHPLCWSPFVRTSHGHGTIETRKRVARSITPKSPYISPKSPLVQLVSDSSDEEESEAVEGEMSNGFMIRAESEPEEQDATSAAHLLVDDQYEAQLASFGLTIHDLEVSQVAGAVDGKDDEDGEDWGEEEAGEDDEYENWSESEAGEVAGPGDQPATLPAYELLPPARSPNTAPYINGNGKRTSPPDENDEPTVSKRRLSDDGQVIEISSEDVNGTESRDSSSSGPTDPLPLTPEPEVDIISTYRQDDKKGQGQEAVTSVSSLIAYHDLPHVPHHTAKLGPRTEKIIRDLLQQALEPIRACRCKICERARNVEKLREAQYEALLSLSRGSW